jgi:Ca2+-binding RTX toxin-like protein
MALGCAQALAAATTVAESPDPDSTELDVDDVGSVANTINVSVAGNTITVTDTTAGVNNVTPLVCTTINATTVDCPLDPPDPAAPAPPTSPVFDLQVDLHGGIDTYANQNFNAVDNSDVDGSDGNKTISSGPGDDNVDMSGGIGTSSINAGDGNDEVDPGDGDDTVNTGNGNDFVNSSLGVDNVDLGAGRDDANGGVFNDGNDGINGGPGANDDIFYSSGFVGVHVSLDGVANDGHGSEADNVLGFEEVDGTLSADTLVGDNGDNELDGGDGNDSISGLGGADEISAGGGNDTVDAGGGNDTVEAGSQNTAVKNGSAGGALVADGADAMNGGAGSDVVDYCCGSDPVTINQNGLADDGQAGEGDNLAGFEGFDGSEGADTITGNASANLFFGEGGNDRLVGGGGGDQFFAGPGDDTAIGGAGRDDFRCDLGFDSVIASPGDEVQSGCERTGATPRGDSAKVKVKGKHGSKSFAKVEVSCPASESAPCKGKVSLLENGKVMAKGKMKVAAGKTRNVKAKLTKKGRGAFRKSHGSLPVSADAKTTEPAGTTVNEAKLVLTG